MTTESLDGSEQIDLKRNLHQFVEAISSIGRNLGLNPHFEEVHLEDTVAKYSRPIAIISEDGFAGKLKRLVGAGYVARIYEAPPNNGLLVDYLFVHKSPLKPEVYFKLHKLVEKAERRTGVRIYLAPKGDRSY